MRPTRALDLSDKEHDTLLNLLDWYLGRNEPQEGQEKAKASEYVNVLRAIRQRLKMPDTQSLG